ncbi:MAG: hypothetical protein JRN52_11770 [Nitrososphaerota archaeon]|nr:hypothetical protein [Nitrososphaerota archaeon]
MKNLKATLAIALIIASFTFAFAPPFSLGGNALYSSGAAYTYTIFTATTNQESNPPTVTHFTPNSTIVIEGSVCPNPIIGILNNIYANVTYTRPDGSTFTDSTTLAANQYDYCSGGGDLVDSIQADMQGTWHVQSVAYIDWGNGTLTDVSSNTVSFTVAPASSSLTELALIPLVVIVIIVGVAFMLLRRRGGRQLPPPPA